MSAGERVMTCHHARWLVHVILALRLAGAVSLRPVSSGEQRDLQIAALALAVAACVALRLTGVSDPGPVELLPVLGAAWWFGRRAALVVAGVACAVLVLAVLVTSAMGAAAAAVTGALLVLSAQVTGALVEAGRRQAHDLERLRPLQDALAPRVPQRPPLLDIASRYITAAPDVSGDFYLVAEGHNNATVVVIGDVAGKGMEAAKRATFVRATLNACAPYSGDPAHMLRTVNAELIRQYGTSTQFITMLCVVVHPDATVNWCSAGHPPPVALADGRPIGAPRVGFPLGIAAEIEGMEVATTDLPDSGILLYTDGLIDARPPGGTFQPFGDQRVANCLRELERPTPEEAVERLAAAAQVFARGTLPDDLCLVALRSRFDERWHRGPPAVTADTAAGPGT
jgi:serine phosphatase RsbU (regulator of sigma subunit)